MTAKTAVSELYTALFNRAPDSDGLNYWTSEVDNGASSLESISKNMVELQAEGLALSLPTMSNSDFIQTIYINVLDRAPDSQGMQYWMDQLSIGAIDRDVFVLALINGAKSNTSAQGLRDGAMIGNKAQIGIAFAEKGLNDVMLAAKVLKTASADSDSLSATLSLLKFVPEASGPQTTEIISAFSATLEKVANIYNSAPEQLHSFASYLNIIGEAYTDLTNIEMLLNIIGKVATSAIADPSVLGNPSALAQLSVIQATPDDGHSSGTAPIPTAPPESPSFDVAEVDGVLKFSGTAMGDISIFVDNGLVTAVRENVTSKLQTVGPQIGIDLPAKAGLTIESGTTISLTAEQANDHNISGLGSVNIVGAVGDQTIVSSAQGTIEGGAGADNITLGNLGVSDTIIISVAVDGFALQARDDAQLLVDERSDLTQAFHFAEQAIVNRQEMTDASNEAFLELGNRNVMAHAAAVSTNTYNGFVAAKSAYDTSLEIYEADSSKAAALVSSYKALYQYSSDYVQSNYPSAILAMASDTETINAALANSLLLVKTSAEKELANHTAEYGSSEFLTSDAISKMNALSDAQQLISDSKLQTDLSTTQLAFDQDVLLHGDTVGLLTALQGREEDLNAKTLSDSNWIKQDTIKGFELGTDKINLGNYHGYAFATVAGDVSIDSNGMAHRVSDNSVNLTLSEVFSALDTDNRTVAFVSNNVDGTKDTYLINSDGMPGMQEADTVVKFVGVAATSLAEFGLVNVV